jgi:hypothetical protein
MMNKLIIGMAFLGGLVAFPAFAEDAYPLHTRDAQNLWMWDVEPKAEAQAQPEEQAQMAKAQIAEVSAEADNDTNDLGW